MKKQVILYTSKGCTKCKNLKKWLRRNKVPFTEKDLSNTDIMTELVMRNLVVLSAPILKTKNKFFLPHQIFGEDGLLRSDFRKREMQKTR